MLGKSRVLPPSLHAPRILYPLLFICYLLITENAIYFLMQQICEPPEHTALVEHTVCITPLSFRCGELWHALRELTGLH